jgi:hypothetical protein
LETGSARRVLALAAMPLSVLLVETKVLTSPRDPIFRDFYVLSNHS